jgi:hypothetical protein
VEDCLRQGRILLQPAQLATGSSTTLTAVKLHEEVYPGAQYTVYIWLYTYILQVPTSCMPM